MPIRFRCAYCSQLMGIARRKAGTVVRCPKCRGQILVPAMSEEESSVTPPPSTAASRPAGAGQLAPGAIFEFSDVDGILPGPSAHPASGDQPIDVVPLSGPGSVSGYFVTTKHLLIAGTLIVILLVTAFFLGWFLRK